MSVKITYRLTNAGQRASLLAGGDGKAYQIVDVPHDAPEYALAVELADIDPDGVASVTEQTNHYCERDYIKYDATTNAVKLLSDEQQRRANVIAKEEERIARQEAEIEAKVQEYLAGGPESLIFERTNVYVMDELSYVELAVRSELTDDRLDDIRAEAKKIIADRNAIAKEEALAIKAAARQAAGKDAADWIEQHGSERLKRCHAEEIECGAAYRDERLKKERPGWVWIDSTNIDTDEPRNPSLKAFTMLDEARKLEPEAVLRYGTIDHDGEDDEYLDEPASEYDWTGYVAEATFLDRDILFVAEDTNN